MTLPLRLLPQPRQTTVTEGAFFLAPERLIVLDAPEPAALTFTAARVQRALRERAGLHWPVSASPAVPETLAGLVLRLAPDRGPRPQGYHLAVTPERIVIEAGDAAGLFYGACTLVQLLETTSAGAPLPALRVIDWPDFPARGVMLDISRNRVPTMETLYALVDRLAGWKINQLQLYTEHTFAYRRHPEVWADASPMTGDEILALEVFCRERFIELVPNQNSFGHLTPWLKHPRYAPLAEVTAGFDAPWGPHPGPFSLCPLDPGSLALVREMYDELLPHFASRMINVGCDETFDLGQGRSRRAVAERGVGRVYLDFVKQIHAEVAARGRQMQFWGDIIIQHPDLIPELPRDAIALAWGYEADHPFAAHGARFAQAGLPFYVCPGTSAWNSVAGRTTNALGNTLAAAESGLRHGAAGCLITDWGDNGHWQPAPVSDLGFAAGAAYSWALDANRGLDLADALSRHAYHDPTGALGRVAFALGDAYRAAGIEPPNSSALFWMLQWPLERLRNFHDAVPTGTLDRVLDAVEAAVAPLAAARPDRPDAGLLRREFAWAARLLRHAALRAQFAFNAGALPAGALRQDLRECIVEFQQLWLARSRPGGLPDSLALFERPLHEYA